VFVLEQVCGSFTDDDAGRHGVSSSDARHDGRMRNPKPFDSTTFSVPSTTDMSSVPIFAVPLSW